MAVRLRALSQRDDQWVQKMKDRELVVVRSLSQQHEEVLENVRKGAAAEATESNAKIARCVNSCACVMLRM